MTPQCVRQRTRMSTPVRALLAGLLSELQQIRVVLLAMRDGDGHAVTR